MASFAQSRWRGYVEIATAALLLSTTGTAVQVSTMPAGLLAVARMALAGLVLGALFLLTGGLTEVRDSGRLRRLVVLGVAVALELIFFFAAVRLSDVTVAVSLEYLAPVWVALVAPWVLHTRRHAVDMVAVGVAGCGMALIVVPGFSAGGAGGSPLGVTFGLLAGVMFAVAMLLVKSMGKGVRGSTMVLFYCLCSVVLLAPLAWWQTASGGYRLTATDLWIVVLSGLVYTALCFSLFTDGIRYVRVEHAGIIGYLEPVTAPVWALLLIGEHPAWTTWAGAALIIAAGMAVVALGSSDAELPT